MKNEVCYYDLIMNSELTSKMDKIEVLSPTKFGRYKRCPYGFMLTYICDFRYPPNIFMKRGIDVHDFHNKFFDDVYREINDNQKILVSNELLELAKKSYYKQNILQYYNAKWEKCLSEKLDSPESYFFPVIKEKMIEFTDKKIHGIPDAVERDFDGVLRIVEVKTGKPSQKKADGYLYDLVWYKLLVEHLFKCNVDSGRIYFPYDNTEYFFKLSDKQEHTLLEEINQVRRSIRSCEFSPNPEYSKCMWCDHNKMCQYSLV